MAAPELLESGPADDSRWTLWHDRHRRALAIALVALTVVGAGAALAWSLRPRPPLSVVDAEVVGTSRLIPDPQDGGAAGALGAPAMTAVPMSIVSLSVRNESENAIDVRVMPRTAGPLRLGFGSTAAGLPAWSQATIPPAGAATVPLTVSPTDCAHRPSDADLDGLADDLLDVVADHGSVAEAPAVGSPGPGVARALGTALDAACAAGGRTTVSVSGSPRSGRGVTTALLQATADPDAARLVVTPLDADGLRGLGSVGRDGSGPVTVTWESAGDAAGPLRVQVFAVDGALAVPYLLDVGPR